MKRSNRLLLVISSLAVLWIIIFYIHAGREVKNNLQFHMREVVEPDPVKTK
jgi:hypothetical protein